MRKNTSQASLLICILMDIIGYATYSIPVFGELGDIVWAPISAIIFYRTDFIPSFTIMWIWQSLRKTADNRQSAVVNKKSAFF
jgi:hypothetical protein